MKIAVTGGSGEIGRDLVPYLLEEGHDVVSIDFRIPPLPTTWPKRMANYQAADVRNFGEVVSVLEGCEAVIHLAAHRSPTSHPAHVVYNDNTTGSYNVLCAAGMHGIKRVCLASSVNAIGLAFSRQAQHDYFPLDEEHPTYAEDPYSLSKWVLEQQADSFVRRYEWMTVASLRFHWIKQTREEVVDLTARLEEMAIRHLWAYTLVREASRACLLSLTADFSGHEAFYIVAPKTAVEAPSRELAQKHYPDVPIRGDFAGTTAFFDSSKAERLLGWTHKED